MSVWIANRLPNLPVLVRREQPREHDPTFSQPLLAHDLVYEGEMLEDPIYCQGWFAGQGNCGAYLSDLKTVAWAMPIGLRTRLRFAETAIGPLLVVLEGAWRFTIYQSLYTDGCFTIDSDYENEHYGQVLDTSTYPAKDGQNLDQRQHEWIRAHARSMSERQ